MNRLAIQAAGTCVLTVIFMQYVAYAVECPPKEMIKPCICGKFSGEVFVSCNGLRHHDILSKIFERVDGWKFDTLQIDRSIMLYIPSSIFEKAEFQNLFIETSILTSLFDSEPISGSSLKKLVIRDGKIQQGIRWSLLTNFELNNLQLYKIPMRELSKDFKEHVGKSNTLKTLILTFNGIRRLTNQPFENLHNLEVLYLDGQKFAGLEPLTFPKNLKTLTLSGNNLSTLPDNFFGNRPTLEVHIGWNGFTTVSKKIFGGIRHLHIQANALDCNCGMKWLTDEENKFLTLEGICWYPSTLKDKELDKLEQSDFNYCR